MIGAITGRRFAALATLAIGIAPAAAAAQTGATFEVPERIGAHWFKGNTHTHTTESDGDSPPEVVARWYRDHGYAFLVISDHNVWTDPSKLSHLVDSTFILIPGEEVSSGWEGRPVHVNGLNTPHVIEPLRDSTLVGTIQKNVDAVREVEGVPHINHPNFRWAIDAETLARIERDRLIEIHNGHPQVHNHGGGGTPGMEEVWDYLLTGGKRIYGIAVDDAHHFQGEFAADRANPGRGWVAVNADRLEAREVLGAMEEGRFYASTGVELEDVEIAADRITVRIRQALDFRYTTTFIADGGRELAVVHGTEPSYALTVQGGHGEVAAGLSYVRAKVVDSGGRVAWVQPVFIRR